MHSSTHPVEREELMAYFDGELPAERAAQVAAHLEKCAACTVLAADLNSVAEPLSAWQVEPAPPRLTERVTAALASRPLPTTPPDEKKLSSNDLARPRRRVIGWALGFAGALAFFLLVAAVSIPNLLRSRIRSDRARETVFPSPAMPAMPAMKDERAVGVAGGSLGALPAAAPEQSPGPMIARAAELALITKEFDKTRSAVEAAVRAHHGYIAQLSVTAPANSGRSLTATLRVPSAELDALLAELKKLGRVEQESQSGEEVTRQYVDLGARLSNARATEQRLIEVLRQRTGKVGDVLSVEREIARVREEIERLDAERKTLENRVSLASLELRLNEEYKAQIEVAPPSTGTRLHNALVSGCQGATGSVLGLVLFLFTYGPTLIFWTLLLFWPARFAWKRLRPRTTTP